MDIATVFNHYAHYLEDKGFRIVEIENNRPWGGYFVVDESQVKAFAAHFFSKMDIAFDGKLSPKVLLVAPGKRLSWQYHHRRSEVWKCMEGSVHVALSNNDAEGEAYILLSGEVILIPQGVRHRLMGLDNWGVVAEIWQHTDPAHPSDEDYIVRLQDDFGR